MLVRGNIVDMTKPLQYTTTDGRRMEAIKYLTRTVRGRDKSRVTIATCPWCGTDMQLDEPLGIYSRGTICPTCNARLDTHRYATRQVRP